MICSFSYPTYRVSILYASLSRPELLPLAFESWPILQKFESLSSASGHGLFGEKLKPSRSIGDPGLPTDSATDWSNRYRCLPIQRIRWYSLPYPFPILAMCCPSNAARKRIIAVVEVRNYGVGGPRSGRQGRLGYTEGEKNGHCQTVPSWGRC